MSVPLSGPVRRVSWSVLWGALHPISFFQVTHNPDVETYADRIVYVSDGQFQKQVINVKQARILALQPVRHPVFRFLWTTSLTLTI